LEEYLLNVLVIGGTRFMGIHLIKRLLSEHHNVTIATRGQTEDNFGNKVTRIIFDRTNKNSIEQKLSGLSFDVVFDSLVYCSNDIKILLDNISFNRYLFISSTAIYNKHLDIKEKDFNPSISKMIWCNRSDFSYAENKRQAERAIAQAYSNKNILAVRFPFVVGEDDYTNRLYFYVEHIIKQRPMYIDNYEAQLAFIRADEAGDFLAFFIKNSFNGAINGASTGTISIKQIADYVYTQTGKKIIISIDGEKGPYNGEAEHSINTEQANKLGYYFLPLNNWIFDLLNYYINKVNL
jgi:nucleoside-diphosphate-sugar epimerase